MKFYNVDLEYIKYLKNEEVKKRGFSKVPDIEYKDREKFLVGIVLKIKDMDYFAPVSSFKKQQKTNVIIKDKNGQELSSVRLSFMFPVPKGLATIKDFSKLEFNERNLLHKEYEFCKSNSKLIQDKANTIYNKFNAYNKIKEKTDFQKLFLDCCGDFSLYEEKYKEYISKMVEVKNDINIYKEDAERRSLKDIKIQIENYKELKKEKVNVKINDNKSVNR